MDQPWPPSRTLAWLRNFNYITLCPSSHPGLLSVAIASSAHPLLPSLVQPQMLIPIHARTTSDLPAVCLHTLRGSCLSNGHVVLLPPLQHLGGANVPLH
jgi:hypothetical protein